MPTPEVRPDSPLSTRTAPAPCSWVLLFRFSVRRALRSAPLLLLVLVSAVCSPASEERAGDLYDLVIAGGRVIDPESGLDAVRHVGIRGERVAVVSEDPLNGERTLDAEGMVVAPGFVDILASYPNANEAAAFKVFDGVTTLVGMHGGPVDPAGWYAEREAVGAFLHYGTAVGHRALREAAGVTDRYRAADAAEVDTMVRMAREALEAGAVGIGFGIAYVPGASRTEVFRLFELAAELSVPAHLHIRAFGPVPPNAGGLGALQEVIADAAATGASAQVVHINSMLGGQMQTALRMLEGARERGVDVMADVYPYTAAATSLASTTFDPGWQERFGGISYGDLQLVRTMERLDREGFQQGREAGETAIIHYMRPEEIRAALLHPHVMVASDGTIVDGRGHPRGAGTFARVLGRYVREEGVLTLPGAIRKMSWMPARRLEGAAPDLVRKGRLSSGADADIVVFDPETVIDRADFTDPARRSEGIRWTVVLGQVVVDDGELVEEVRPGRPIRGRRHPP